MIRNLVPILLLGLIAAASASVLIGREHIEQWMGDGVWAYAVAVAAGIPAYVCERGVVPLTAALVTMGGNWSRLYLHGVQAVHVQKFTLAYCMKC